MSTGARQPASVTASAPGKVILSGEHAVVFGRPALVMAVDLRASVAVTSCAAPGVDIDLQDMTERAQLSWEAVRARSDLLVERYETFLAGALGIEAVADSATDLAAFGLDLVTRRFFLKPEGGLALRMSSALPLGCGMGSSAAAAAALLTALTAFFGVTCDRDRLLAYALEIEKLQHGRPSGVDPYMALHGGCVRFRQGQAEKHLGPPALPLHFVQTGRPASTTGECVMHVAKHFEHNPIWEQFEGVTLGLEAALATADFHEARYHLRLNHHLLHRVGVVPERIAAFVERVEREGGAAKLCGAGSIRGEAGGVLLMLSEADPRPLCEAFGYELLRLAPDTTGAEVHP